MASMQPICPCCHTSKRAQYCQKCLQEGLATHQRLFKNLQSQCTTSIAGAQRRLESGSCRNIGSWRQLRAEVGKTEQRVRALRRRLAQVEGALGTVAGTDPFVTSTPRRPSLEDSSSDLRQAHAVVLNRQHEVDLRLAHARKVLVGEVIQVFGIERMSQYDWVIARLRLGLPQDLQKSESHKVNAALSHIVHAVHLLTSYLSVALPYTPEYSSVRHIGKISMRANLPYLQTTKLRDKHVLWMSSTASRLETKARSKYRQFLTSYALLAHSISYLAWTQGVQGIGVNEKQAGDQGLHHSSVLIPATAILQLLDELSRSPTLGTRSHIAGSHKLTNLGFSLDVFKVIDSTLPDDLSTNGIRKDEWDLVDMDDSIEIKA